LQAADVGFEAGVRQLLELMAIASVSSDPARTTEVARAAIWLREHLQRIPGLAVELLELPGAPMLLARTRPIPGAPTVGLYGHFDVVDAIPAQWHRDPFTPVVEDGVLYGRGSADSKAQLWTLVKALDAFSADGGPPCNVVLMLDGEEEVGGTGLAEYAETHASEMACDYLFAADANFLTPTTPTLVTRLRGYVSFDVIVHGIGADVHPNFSGVAPNPINVIARIAAALDGDGRRVELPGLYDTVVPPSDDERAQWATLGRDEAALGTELRIDVLGGDPAIHPLERMWARPSFDLIGITEPVKPRTIPARAVARMRVSLVANQSPSHVLDLLTARIRALTPAGMRTEIAGARMSAPAHFELTSRARVAADRAFRAHFGHRPMCVGSGATVPALVRLHAALHPQMLVSGFGLPDDNPHGVDEHFTLEQLRLGTRTVITLLDELASGAP
jgi:acetylornithine deacetylase/succinyl-diaminopimelate desuccinylase-like protein